MELHLSILNFNRPLWAGSTIAGSDLADRDGDFDDDAASDFGGEEGGGGEHSTEFSFSEAVS